MRKFISRHSLLLGLCLALALAGVFPGQHDAGGWIAFTCIAGIFFFSGYALPAEELGRSFLKVRFHLVVQGFSFVLIPALAWLALLPLHGRWNGALIAGVYALACLPTTVSSCVAFTNVAGGNVAASLFNAVLGNAIGVVLTPVLLGFFLGHTNLALPFSAMTKVWLNLAFKVVAPFVVGQGMRAASRRFALSFRPKAMALTSFFLLCLVFLVFANALHEPELRAAARVLPELLGFLCAIHVACLLLACGLGSLPGFSKGDNIALLFTAPQKTLSLGAPLISAYFASRPELIAPAMLPLLLYHPLQLLFAGLLAGRIRARMSKKA